jgi:hypothetical protein
MNAKPVARITTTAGITALGARTAITHAAPGSITVNSDPWD